MSGPSHENWLQRWEQGNIGWHESAGSDLLRKWWDVLPSQQRVLVPLCGKALDLLWLEQRGHHVTGVELSAIAIEAFFAEHQLEYTTNDTDGLVCYRANDRHIEIFCGDYFSFNSEPFSAVFDRGALVALPPALRAQYAEQTTRLMAPGAAQLLITLSYAQEVIAGPPFSVESSEVRSYWPGLPVAEEFEALQQSPPKFRQAGLKSVMETLWYAPGG